MYDKHCNYPMIYTFQAYRELSFTKKSNWQNFTAGLAYFLQKHLATLSLTSTTVQEAAQTIASDFGPLPVIETSW